MVAKGSRLIDSCSIWAWAENFGQPMELFLSCRGGQIFGDQLKEKRAHSCEFLKNYSHFFDINKLKLHQIQKKMIGMM